MPVTLAPGEASTVEIEYEIDEFPVDWRAGTFEIVLQPQGTARPDVVELALETPEGYTVENELRYSTRVELAELTRLRVDIDRE